jgi:alcohol dehydrogenase (cytochrome c)
MCMRAARALGCALPLALVLAGCGGTVAAHRPKPRVPQPASANWSLSGQNAWADRTAPVAALTPQTASQLSLAFSVPLGPAGSNNECYPLEQDGVLYVTGPGDLVEAISAASGKVLWSYRPAAIHQPVWAPVATRGVALGDGLVFLLAADDQLTALDAKTGAVRYSVQVASPAQGYFETMNPVFAKGKVIVGSSGGDEGNRGFVAAYDAPTGQEAWRFYTIPARGTSWVPATGHHGGGAVWTSPTYDPQNGLLYVPVGNPSPDYFGVVRPGPDLYTDSVVALRIGNGTVAWYRQEVPHDLWDYDVASPPLLMSVNGTTDVAEAGKDGYLYAWNAGTGASAFAPVAFVREDHSPPTPQGVVEWPGADGGANYGPSAYDPRTGLIFVSGIQGGMLVRSETTAVPAQPLDFGTSAIDALGTSWTGTITAVDAKTGKIGWQDATPSPAIGGVTAVRGGVLLFGQENGTLEAVDASSGKAVWADETGMPIAAAPIVYRIGGIIYVAVVTGNSASLRSRFPSQAPSELLVFRLPLVARH